MGGIVLLVLGFVVDLICVFNYLQNNCVVVYIVKFMDLLENGICKYCVFLLKKRYLNMLKLIFLLVDVFFIFYDFYVYKSFENQCVYQ